MARRRGSAIARSATSAARPSPGTGSGSRGRALIVPSSAPQPDLVAVRVGEDGEPAVVAGQVGGQDQPLAAQLLGAVQVGVEVIDPHVDLHALLAPLGRADAPSDRAFACAGVDQAVPAHGGVGGHLPAEQLTVELLRPLVIGADHLEERHWLTHDLLPLLAPSVSTNVSSYER